MTRSIRAVPVVMLASGTHLIEGVALVRVVDSLVRYDDAHLIERRFELDLAGDVR